VKKTFTTFILAFSSLSLWQDGMAETISDDPGITLCPQSLNIPARPTVDEVLGSEDIHLSADEADLIEKGTSQLMGNAEITRGSQQVRADRVEYDQPQDTADMEGDVHYWDETLFLHSDQAHLEFEDGTGQFQRAEFIIKDNRGRGQAEELTLDIGTKTDLKDVDYTTCDPDDNFWKLSASKISLDHIEDWGSARNVVLRIKNVPVFYSPYMSFPLSKKRKSGFLTPGFGSSNRNGIELRTPYYWNIRPTMDATFTPRILGDSGVMLTGEYRYLFSRSQGELDIEYLPSDNEFDDEHRSLVSYEHSQNFLTTGRLYLKYNQVSDKNYFEDFGNNLAITSTRFLESRADVSYSRKGWYMFTRVQDFQTVDRSISVNSRPYKRLPQIRLNYTSPYQGLGINYGLRSEIVSYDRGKDLDNENVNGLRLDLLPSISYPIQTVSSFIKPKLGLRFTQYNLEDNNTFEDSPSRTLPIFSLDSGVIFERNFNLAGKDYLQTLEPRLYYLYIPEDDQTDLPVFDTGLYDFSFNSLFREDRFSGPDRMGDANQVTLAVTTHFINQQNGRSAGHISLGQIYYFRDREVGLPSAVVQDDTLSPIIAEISSSLFDNWYFFGDIQWDPNDNRTQKMTFRAQYQPAANKVLNLAYRERRAQSGVNRRNAIDIDQTNLSFRWPIINPRWSVVGNWNYAISENKSLDLFGGIEYNSCCWGMRAVARRYLTDIDGDFQTGVFLQLELKGLAGIGKKTVGFLEQKIPGYRSEF
jgi:LPS-assembly protein